MSDKTNVTSTEKNGATQHVQRTSSQEEFKNSASKYTHQTSGKSAVKTNQITDKITDDKSASVARRIVVDPSVPLAQRPFKMHFLRSFLTQFDGSQHSGKLREEGAEHQWIGEKETMQKSGTWWT